MTLRCPHAEKARQNNCPDIAQDDRCMRKEWSGITHYTVIKHGGSAKAEVYCERIKSVLHEE